MTSPDAPAATDATTEVVAVELGRGVRAGFSTTALGNLGTGVGDDPARVARARARLESWAGAPVAYGRQVHGADVHVVAAATAPGAAPVVDADALVSTRRDVALGVVVADCVPVLLAEPERGVVGVAHAGRRGAVSGVVPALLAAMVAAGADPRHVRAVIGPAACGRCYEVPAALRAEVDVVLPGAASTTSWGTPALDLPGAVEAQLRAAGVGHVHRAGGCTVEDARWYSHRGATGGSVPAGAPPRPRPVGRIAGVVRLLGADDAPGGVSPGGIGGPRLA